MPGKEELISFSASIDAESKEAAAALASLEAERERQQAELRQACLSPYALLMLLLTSVEPIS